LRKINCLIDNYNLSVCREAGGQVSNLTGIGISAGRRKCLLLVRNAPGTGNFSIFFTAFPS
jgi:hypothetical protein